MKLYQINLTKEDARRVNAGETDLPVYKAHCDAMCCGKFPGRKFYSWVANIGASSLEDAFQIGNIGPEEKIERLAPMHSVSVGDVLVTGNRAYIVASFGFREVTEWVAPVVERPWLDEDDGESSTYKPENAVLYDGTPGSASIRRR